MTVRALVESRWAGGVSRALGIPAERLGASARKVVFALADQALAAGANFLLAVVLARAVSAEEYGFFALLYYSVYVGFLGFYSALILQPLMVYGAASGENLPVYLRRADRLQRWAGAGLGALLAAGGAAYWLWARGSGEVPVGVGLAPVLALALAAPALCHFQFARTACYLSGSPRLAAVRAAVYATVLVVGISALHLTGWLNAASALLLMGLAGWIGAAVAARRLYRVSRADAGGGKATSIRLGAEEEGRADEPVGHILGNLLSEAADPDIRVMGGRFWSFGRWAAATNVVYWLAGNAIYVLPATVLGLGATGTVRAVQNLFLPFSQVSVALGQLYYPWLARRPETALTFSRRLAVGLGAAALAYLALAAGTGSWVMRWLYTGRYAYDAALVLGLGVGFLVMTVSQVLLAGLKVRLRPQWELWAFATTAAAGWPLGWWMLGRWGMAGLAVWAALVPAIHLGVVLAGRWWDGKRPGDRAGSGAG